MKLPARLEGDLAQELDSLGVVPIDGQVDGNAVDPMSHGFCDAFADLVGIAKDQGFADHLHDPIVPTLELRDFCKIGVGFFQGGCDDDHQELRHLDLGPVAPQPLAVPDLPTLFAALRDECERNGRDPGEVELTTGGAVRSLSDIKRFEDMGVSRLIISPPGFDRDAIEKGLEKLGNDLISKL